MSPTDARSALSDLAREHSGRVLAVLANRFGDLDLADDAVQEAMARASERWGRAEPVPDNLGGWLMTVSRRIVIDELRARQSRSRRLDAAASELATAESPAVPLAGHDLVEDTGDATIDDDRLRLVLLCCHPALNQQAQVALTLRLVAGLTTDEIAAAHLVPTPTIAQRITRAKRKIRDAAIPLVIPSDLPDRLGMVRAVIYLTYNEGYLSRSGTDGALRLDLCDTAVDLARSLDELAPDQPETLGLLALMACHDARRSTRLSIDNELVQLVDQDRTRWDASAIADANRLLARAMGLRQPGPYQVQALIAAHHVNATAESETDWKRILGLYEQLQAMTGSSVVGLNAMVARSHVHGPQAALDSLDAIDGLDDYHLLHSTRAHLLDELGRHDEAAQSWRQAFELTSNPAERGFIAAKLN